MKIHIVHHHDVAVTGGQKYNDQFEKYLESISGLTIFKGHDPSKIYIGIKKLLAPLLQLKDIKIITRGDIVFWGDTSYIYNFFFLPVCRLFRHTKNIVIIHHFPFLNDVGLLKVVHKYLQLFHYSLMDYIIVPSPYTKTVAERYFAKRKIIYIPLPFEKKCFISNEYNRGELLYVGTIEKRKGIHLLLESLNILLTNNKNVHLKIIGKVVDQDYFDDLKEYVQINRLQENVEFLGRVSLEQLNDAYTAAEMFVLPSSLEGYGIVLVEAMQHGLPLIAFNNSAMPYTIIPDYNGYLAQDGDSKDLACQISKILGDEKTRYRLQKGVYESMMSIKTTTDFRNSIQFFYNVLAKDIYK